MHLCPPSRGSHAFWCVWSSPAAPPPTPPPTHCPALCPGKGRSDSYKWHCPTSLISCLEGGFGQWEAPARGWKKREGVGVFHPISVLLQNEFLAMVVSFCTFSETFQISQEHLYLFPRAAVNGLPQQGSLKQQKCIP